MAAEQRPREGSRSIFARAANRLNPIYLITSNHGSVDEDIQSPAEKRPDETTNEKSKQSHNFNALASVHETNEAEDKDRQRYARTIPPWVHSLEEGEDEDEIMPTARLLSTNSFPAPVRPAQHHYLPLPRWQAPTGRKFDHERTKEAVVPTPRPHLDPRQWQAFLKASDTHPAGGQHSEIVDEKWIEENCADLHGPWNPDRADSTVVKPTGLWILSPERRDATATKFHDIMMNNPFVPAAVRIFVLCFVLSALALGAYIYKDSRDLNFNSAATAGTMGTSDDYICTQQASTYMAFIVDSVAVLYILYITYDEYFSKPLGLRRSRDKMRLLFLDLIFIVFSAANLALAFNTLTDKQWACYRGNPLDSNSNNAQAAQSTCVYSPKLCNRQKALVSVLTVAEAAWVVTFAISTLRVVERISR